MPGEYYQDWVSRVWRVSVLRTHNFAERAAPSRILFCWRTRVEIGFVVETIPPMKIATFVSCLVLTASNGLTGEIAESQKKWIEVYEKQPNVPKPGDMLVNEDKEPDLNEGFVDLYNGKDLSNWEPKGGTCTFEAKEGYIEGTCVPGSPSTYLSTKKNDYSDFVFTAELKYIVDGNTGIMFRADAKPGKKGETVFGPQAEMEAFSKERYWSGGIYGQGAGGWIYPMWLKAHEEARNSMKRESWNRITVKAEGDTIKTWINRRPAAHWKTDEYTKGYFGLQIHSGKEGQIQFRNIKVKELN